MKHKIAVLAAGALFALAAPADAHALLQRASPAAGAVLPGAPIEIRLKFSERVEPRLCTIALEDSAGHDLPIGTPTRVGDGATLIARIDVVLGPGPYHVRWRAVSVDTHVTEGDYGFRISP